MKGMKSMSETFVRVSEKDYGYNPDQVDTFLAEAKEAYSAPDDSAQLNEDAIRAVHFDWVRGGYDPAIVDAALDRMEVAFIQRRRANVIAAEGEDAWLAKAYEQAQTLYPRLLRPEGERFANAAGQGYKKSDVDALLARVSAYFDGKASLTSGEVRMATFASAKRAKAYDEAVVDVFLDRVVSVLLAVE